MIELIIFDWDDVFTLGSTDGYKKCYHAAVSGIGINLSPAEEMKRMQAKWGGFTCRRTGGTRQGSAKFIE
jgi:hypothetical protein